MPGCRASCTGEQARAPLEGLRCGPDRDRDRAACRSRRSGRSNPSSGIADAKVKAAAVGVQPLVLQLRTLAVKFVECPRHFCPSLAHIGGADINDHPSSGILAQCPAHIRAADINGWLRTCPDGDGKKVPMLLQYVRRQRIWADGGRTCLAESPNPLTPSCPRLSAIVGYTRLSPLDNAELGHARVMAASTSLPRLRRGWPGQARP